MTAFILNCALAFGLVLFLSMASRLFGPKRVLPGDKGLPYETGMPPVGGAFEHMSASYYKFAVLFVLFDIDLAFLIPWITLRGALTLDAMLSMTVFLAMVGLTLALVWKKGALTCK